MRKVLLLLGLVAALVVVPAIAQELIVTPGSSDGFFDGSDHQTSGIDIWIDAPDWGSIPEPGPPEIVTYESDEYSRSAGATFEKTNDFANATAYTRRPTNRGNVIGIVYKDSSVQYVPLTRDFSEVSRIKVADIGTASTVQNSIVGRWRTAEWGTVTLRRDGDRIVGTATKRGIKIEAQSGVRGVVEGTWCDSSRSSGRVTLIVAANGRDLRGTWFRGARGAGGTLSGTKLQ